MSRFPLSTVTAILLGGAMLAGCYETTSFTGITTTTRPVGGVSESGYDLTPIPADKADEMAKGLSELAYHVTRKDGTERSGSSELNANKQVGVYACAVCDLPVYSSETKFESGTGWPSFWEKLDPAHVRDVEDRSGAMVRTEVECARCASHLGHVFTDGPEPTGMRHCLNGVALKFYPKGQEPKPTPTTPATQPAQ